MADNTTTSTTESLEYRAEVKQLLDILAHSLYTDREVFLPSGGRYDLSPAYLELARLVKPVMPRMAPSVGVFPEGESELSEESNAFDGSATYPSPAVGIAAWL